MKRLFVLALLVAGSAQAVPEPAAVPGPEACVAQTTDQSKQIACVAPTLESSSQELNQIYQRFQAALKDKQTPGGSQNLYYANLSDSLRMAERSWIQDQVNECEFEGNLKSRKAFVLVTEMLCTLRTNKMRTQELKGAMAELNLN